jgi:ABC-2 type transport system ATP-binding protein
VVLAGPAGTDESGLVGEHHELGPVSRAEFGHRPCGMGFNRRLADVDLPGNLFVGQTCGDQGQYFAFPVGEPLHDVGAVLEASSFHPGRTARNHLRIQALAAAVDPSRIDDVLDLVQLTPAADRRIGGFSLGMRQRLGLATALLPDPEILILDEPANGLDPEGVHWLRGLLRGFAAEGGTVLVSSHMLAEAAQTVDSVVIIDRGRLITQSPLTSLTAQGDLEDAFLQLTGHSSAKEAVK